MEATPSVAEAQELAPLLLFSWGVVVSKWAALGGDCEGAGLNGAIGFVVTGRPHACPNLCSTAC
eukprot:1960584-Amphidinium_carterae.1